MMIRSLFPASNLTPLTGGGTGVGVGKEEVSRTEGLGSEGGRGCHFSTGFTSADPPCWRLIGRYKVKVLPWPSSLATVICPPILATNSRQIDSPRPVPPYLRLVLPSACWKASKMIFCCSTVIPIPVSTTLIAIAWLASSPLRDKSTLTSGR